MRRPTSNADVRRASFLPCRGACSCIPFLALMCGWQLGSHVRTTRSLHFLGARASEACRRPPRNSMQVVKNIGSGYNQANTIFPSPCFSSNVPLHIRLQVIIALCIVARISRKPLAARQTQLPNVLRTCASCELPLRMLSCSMSCSTPQEHACEVTPVCASLRLCVSCLFLFADGVLRHVGRTDV